MPKLVRLARLLNAYHHATRVSFYHRDIARPDTYDEHYGVVLALSVFDRVEGCSPRSPRSRTACS